MTASGVVAIVGAGNLGRRYLEGILDGGSAEVVHVCDISRESLNACEDIVHRIGEGGQARSSKAVYLHGDIGALPRNLDLAIVATSADVRPQLVADLSSYARVGHYVLEKVLAQDEGGLDQLLDATANSRVWVNLPRRMMDWHCSLFDLIRGNGPVSMVVSGGAWGLACNAVHYMDLLMWWSDEAPQTIDTGGLEPAWSPAKREGFWEVYGSMSVTYAGGSRLILHADHHAEAVTIEVEVGGMTWLISESSGVAHRSDGIGQPGVVELQSEITPRVVESILTSGTCFLPTLEEAVGTHRVLIKGLSDHWVRSGGQRNGVPIT